MRRARRAEFFTVYGKPTLEPDDHTDAGRLERMRRTHVQLLDRLLRSMPSEALIAHFNQHGWPDLDTPPPRLSPDEQAALELQAKAWGDQAKAEALELWREHFGDQPAPVP